MPDHTLLRDIQHRLSSGDTAGARDLVGRHLSGKAHEVPAGLVLGSCAMIEGAPDEARGHFRTVLALVPQEPTALANLAAIDLAKADGLLHAGDYAAARDTYAEVLGMDEGNLAALLGLAEAQQELCAYDDAIALYRVALPLVEAPAEILVKLGFCLLERRDTPAAQSRFREALQADPSCVAKIETAYKTASCGTVWLNRADFLRHIGAIS